MKDLLERQSYIYKIESGVWSRASYGGIAYNDGDEVETRLAEIIRKAQDLSVLSDELRPHCTDWPSHYHLGASRANLLRPFEALLKNADVLEIGAGCGAITRYLGESGANVLALEGSVRRATIARSRTRDLENVDVVSERFDEFAIEHTFDVVTLIGVLEYAHQFMPGDQPDVGMLQYARKLLKPEGLLILAIENQLGLKYFAGAPEDHIGLAMYGIESRYKDDQPRTYGFRRIEKMLGKSGLGHLEFMTPFPDYKLPVSIVTEAGLNDPEFDACALACQSVHADPQLPALLSFSPELTWPAVFENGLGLACANSFLIIASKQPAPAVDGNILAYHYSTNRRPEYCKQTLFIHETDGIRNQCQLLSPNTASFPHADTITFHPQQKSEYVPGKSLALEFTEIITRDGWKVEDLEMYFRKYLAALVQVISQDEGSTLQENPGLNDTVSGRYIDAIPQNIFHTSSGQYRLIDTEWDCVKDIPLSRVLFRAMLSLLAGVTRYGRSAASERPMTRGDFIIEVFRRLDKKIRFNLTDSLNEEIAFQELITGRTNQELLQSWPNVTLAECNIFKALEMQASMILEAKAKIKILDEDAETLNKHLEALKSSMSWRLTGPLRLIYSGLICLIHIMHAAKQYRTKHGWRLLTVAVFHAIAERVSNILCNCRHFIFTRLLKGSRARKLTSESALAAINNIVTSRNAYTREMLEPSDFCQAPEVELPEVDISVVTYNSSKWIDTFVTSLLSVDYNKELLKITFVDNSSSDDTVAKIKANAGILVSAGFRVTLLECPNLGYGAGHNTALRQGEAPFCLVTNVDLTFETNSIHKIVSEAVCSTLKTAAWELRQKPYEHPKYYCPVTGLTNWNSHACVLLRRSAFEAVGGYDEALFMYGEDVELSYRLRRDGYLLRYCPHAVVWHFTYESPNQVKALQYRGSLLGNLYIRAKYGRLTDLLRIAPMLISSLLGPKVYKGSRRDALKSHLRLLKLLPRALMARRKTEVRFPFIGWDYDLARDGAFFEMQALPVSPPLVSVITRTTEGRSEYLKQAMLSVVNQTWPNIEYIVVEDGGSTMASIVNGFRDLAGFPIIYISAGRVGRSAVANIGLAKATGRWCLFLDDDDLLFPDHIEVLAGELLKNCEAAAAYSLAWEVKTHVHEGCATWNYKESMVEVNPAHYQEFDYAKICDYNYIPIQSILFERSLFNERGGMNEDMHALEDWVLWAKYAVDNRFAYIPKVTSMYRIPQNRTIEKSRQVVLDEAYSIAVNIVKENAKCYEK